MRLGRCAFAVPLLLGAAAGQLAAQVRANDAPPAANIYRAPSGTTLRLFLDSANVGPDVSLGEMNIPPNTDSGDHKHGAIEMFYVISGELEHVVNGKSQHLTPGMVGYVKPPDTIRHKTGPAGAKVVVVWVPGGEAQRIVARWTKEP